MTAVPLGGKACQGEMKARRFCWMEKWGIVVRPDTRIMISVEGHLHPERIPAGASEALLAPKPTRGGREEMAIATVNPATGQVVKTFESLSDAELEVKLQKAADRFLSYRKTPFAERARLIENAARVLEKEKESYARVMTTEMGKTFRSAVDEAAKCAWVCRYYAENAERILADEVVETTAKRSFIRYLPLGPVLAVMPWNFPFWQVFRFAVPALMAGNVGLLKHASIVPQSALLIEELFQKAGFPDGAFQTLLIGSQKVDRVLGDPRVQAATLTGGDPFDEATELGPLSTAEGLEDLDRDVKASVDAGAKVLTGGKPMDRPGNFYAPTVLTNIPQGSPAHKEELFGPVASVFRAKDLDDAIRIANDSRFGLGASAWTNDDEERERFINELEAGMVFINKMVASDPRLPFGGVKWSGHGRELGVHGIREFTNIKTVWIE